MKRARFLPLLFLFVSCQAVNTYEVKTSRANAVEAWDLNSGHRKLKVGDSVTISKNLDSHDNWEITDDPIDSTTLIRMGPVAIIYQRGIIVSEN